MAIGCGTDVREKNNSVARKQQLNPRVSVKLY